MRIKNLVIILCLFNLIPCHVFPQRNPESTKKFLTESPIVYDIAFSENGDALFVTDIASIRAFRFGDGELIGIFSSGKQAHILALALTSDSLFLAGADLEGNLFLWDMMTRELIHSAKPHNGPVFSISISTCNRYLASGSNQKFELYDLHTFDEIKAFEVFSDDVTDLKFSQDGRWLGAVGADGNIALVSLEDLELKSKPSRNTFLRTLDFNHSGNSLLTAGDDGNLTLWNISEDGGLRERYSQRASPGWLTSVHFRPGENVYLSTDLRGRLRMFFLNTTAKKNLNILIHKARFKPGQDQYFFIAAATHGKGVLIISSLDLEY